MITERIIFLSDVHDCHIDWYGIKTADRMEKMVKDLADRQTDHPADLLIVLGDVSLDFWQWNEKGSYLRTPSVSNTDHFVKNYLRRLPGPAYMIPGNHEQYGVEKWMEITGCPRSYIIEGGNAVFVLLDNFAGNLDPTEHSDGTHTQTNCEMVKYVLEQYPDDLIFLCAHHFDPAAESEEFRRLLAENDHIVALFQGHTHLSNVLPGSDATGGKPILQCGNYSYTDVKGDPADSFWGWRELEFDDDGTIRSFYHVPESRARHGENEIRVEEHDQDEWEVCIPFDSEDEEYEYDYQEDEK